MKKVGALFVLFSLLVMNNLQAQSSPYLVGKNKIGIDLASGVWGRLPLTSEYGIIYNRTITPKFEVGGKLAFIDVNYFSRNLESDDGDRLREVVGINGVGVGTIAQYFLNTEGGQGAFLGLEINYTYAKYINKNDRAEFFNLSKLSTSLLFGYRFNIPSINVELDAFVGVGAAFKNYHWENSRSESSNDNDVVNASWHIGWGLEQEPAIAVAVPVGFRVGYRF